MAQQHDDPQFGNVRPHPNAPQYYPPPPPGYVPAPGYAPVRTNGLAIASMVLGILWLYWIGSILALVFGYIARSQIAERNEAGAGMAKAGIILGYVGLGLFAAAFLVGFVLGLSEV